jgi:hypothetical protein
MPPSVDNAVVRNGFILREKLNFYWVVLNDRNSEQLVDAVQCWDREAVDNN